MEKETNVDKVMTPQRRGKESVSITTPSYALVRGSMRMGGPPIIEHTRRKTKKEEIVQRMLEF